MARPDIHIRHNHHIALAQQRCRGDAVALLPLRAPLFFAALLYVATIVRVRSAPPPASRYARQAALLPSLSIYGMMRAEQAYAMLIFRCLC